MFILQFNIDPQRPQYPFRGNFNPNVPQDFQGDFSDAQGAAGNPPAWALGNPSRMRWTGFNYGNDLSLLNTNTSPTRYNQTQDNFGPQSSQQYGPGGSFFPGGGNPYQIFQRCFQFCWNYCCNLLRSFLPRWCWPPWLQNQEMPWSDGQQGMRGFQDGQQGMQGDPYGQDPYGQGMPGSPYGQDPYGQGQQGYPGSFYPGQYPYINATQQNYQQNIGRQDNTTNNATFIENMLNMFFTRIGG